jgi:hypothetical protein
VQWQSADGGNGHYYEVVSGPMGFPEAQANATAKGGGYLATPNLPGEASFIAANVIAPAGGLYYWLGVYALNASQPWMWVTGGPVTSWAGASTYIDWYGSNGGSLSEGILITSGGRLDDAPYYWSIGSAVTGSVIEYDALPTPIPAAAWLFGSGLAGLGFYRKKTKWVNRGRLRGRS